MSYKPSKTAILIPVYNKLSYTSNCLKSLHLNIHDAGLSRFFETIVIDDGSQDGTSEFIKSEFPTVHVLKGDGNLWWSGGINMGALYARDHLKADFLLLWNNDIGTPENYFQLIAERAGNLKKDEIVGSKIYMKDGLTVWSMGGIFKPGTGTIWMTGYGKRDTPEYKKPQLAQWIPGMGTLFPISIIDRIGLWDQENYPQYHGDLEYTYRAYLAGYSLIIDPELHIINDTENSSLGHEGKFKKLINLFVDKRSLYNYKVNTSFLKKYGKGPLKYSCLLKNYFILVLSYSKFVLLRKGKNT